MKQELLDKIILLKDNILFEEDHNNNCLVGQVNGQQFLCNSGDIDQNTGKIESDIRIQMQDSEIMIGNERDSKRMKARMSNGDIFECIENNDNNICYKKCSSTYRHVEVLSKYSIAPCLDKSEIGEYIAASFDNKMQLGIEATKLNSLNIKNFSDPAFFDKSFLDKLVSAGLISEYTIGLLQNSGVVYSKYNGLEVNEIEKSLHLENEPKSALSHTEVYLDKKSFEQGSKPLLVEVNLLATSQTEYQKFRKAVYVLDASGKYQNVSAIAYQSTQERNELESTIKNAYTPLEFGEMMRYISELNISLNPSQEFKQCCQLDSIMETMQPNLNQIRFTMNNLKFEKYIQALINSHNMQLAKDFGISELQDMGKSK